MSQRNARAIQDIKSRISLVDIARRYMELQRNGHRFVAPCPFHQESKPSFSINEEEGFFYCFGCQAAGDLFDFYGRINGLDFRETLEQLAEEAGVALEKGSFGQQQEKNTVSERKQLLRLHELAAAHFTSSLATNQGKACREYMKERGISPEVAQAFGLGYAPSDWQSLAQVFRRAGFSDELGIKAALLGKSTKNQDGHAYDRFRGRLMFPIKALSGGVVAFGGRIIGQEDEAKYINSSDSPLYKKGEHLYGLQLARRAISTGQPALLTEGYMDVVTLHQFGYTNAVGVLGTALTPEQAKRVGSFTSRLELLFDGDRAGRAAALKACRLFLTKGLSCRVLLFPEGEDIDSFLRTQGTERFEKLRAEAPEGLQFCIQTLRQMAPREAIEFSRAFIKDVELLELAGRYATTLAGGLGISEQELRDFAMTQRQDVVLTNAGHPHKTAVPPRNDHALDKEIMTFAVRYPTSLTKLQEYGAKRCLISDWAKALWAKIEESLPTDVFHTLSDKEKHFWIQCRADNAAPRDNEDGELHAICQRIEREHAKTYKASVTAALQESSSKDDFASELEYLGALQDSLGALQETLEKTNGKH